MALFFVFFISSGGEVYKWKYYIMQWYHVSHWYYFGVLWPKSFSSLQDEGSALYPGWSFFPAVDIQHTQCPVLMNPRYIHSEYTCMYSLCILRSICTYIWWQRSPRWTSGSPRMLLVLVREFESRRGEILNLFAKIKKGSTVESA